MSVISTIVDYFYENYSRFGSSSFVEVTVGVNVAMAGWSQFQNKLKWASNESEEAAKSVTANISDKGSARGKYTGPVFRYIADRVVIVLESIWRIVWILSMIAATMGVCVLYLDHTHWMYILFLSPILIYLCSSFTVLLLFKVIAKSVDWMLGICDHSIEEDIDGLGNELIAGNTDSPRGDKEKVEYPVQTISLDQ